MVKFYRLAQIPNDLRMFGMHAIGDTGPREALGKHLKQMHHTNTNKQTSRITQQIANKVAVNETLANTLNYIDQNQNSTGGKGAVSMDDVPGTHMCLCVWMYVYVCVGGGGVM